MMNEAEMIVLEKVADQLRIFYVRRGQSFYGKQLAEELERVGVCGLVFSKEPPCSPTDRARRAG
jgi:hypothetical protein